MTMKKNQVVHFLKLFRFCFFQAVDSSDDVNSLKYYSFKLSAMVAAIVLMVLIAKSISRVWILSSPLAQ